MLVDNLQKAGADEANFFDLFSRISKKDATSRVFDADNSHKVRH
jgi:hypothetical protein